MPYVVRRRSSGYYYIVNANTGRIAGRSRNRRNAQISASIRNRNSPTRRRRRRRR
jgi:hypothetical protein